MRLVIAGAGSLARDLLRSLSRAWDVTVVDDDAAALASVAGVRPVERVQGAAADPDVVGPGLLDGADAFVAATGADALNLELCARARTAGVTVISAVAADPESLSTYQQAGVAALSPDRLVARPLEINLEPRRVTSATFAQGRAEALEFRIAADSPVTGKSLRELPSADWLVVAVLRDGRLIVPRGTTTLESGDLVTVVGAADEYLAIVKTFTAAEARFPLDFGVAIAVAVTGDGTAPVAEAAELVQLTSAETLVVVHPPLGRVQPARRLRLEEELGEVEGQAGGVPVERRENADPPRPALAGQPDAGVLVVPPGPGDALRSRRFAVDLVAWARRVQRPVLVARGSQPYRAAVVHVGVDEPHWVAAETATDLVSGRDLDVLAVVVQPPSFISNDADEHEVLRAAAQMREEAAVKSVAMRRCQLSGNPVRALVAEAGGDALIVLGLPATEPRLLWPGMVAHLVRRSRSSLLLVPVNP